MKNMTLRDLSKDQLIELVQIYSRNIYALDGVWFQSIEKEQDMDKAMHHDRNAWQLFTQTEARRIKKFLDLPDRAGLEGLERALSFRFSALANPKVEFIREDNTLTYRVVDCRVQTARSKKGMPFHPCKSVGIIEYEYFAKIIDDRIKCDAESCFPDVRDDTCACSWRFELQEI